MRGGSTVEIVDHAQYPAFVFGNAAERMRQRRVGTIDFGSLGRGKNTHYPSSLDLALGEDAGGVIAELISGNLHRSIQRFPGLER